MQRVRVQLGAAALGSRAAGGGAAGAKPPHASPGTAPREPRAEAEKAPAVPPRAPERRLEQRGCSPWPWPREEMRFSRIPTPPRQVVPAFCDLLDCADATLLLSVLEALEAILAAAASAAAAPGENACAQTFAETGGLSKLEALQTHENGEVYRRAVKLLEAFFSADEDDPGLAPTAHADGFAFGLQQQAATQAMHFFP